jgi:hypothetical protein
MASKAEQPLLKLLGEPHRMALVSSLLNGKSAVNVALPDRLADLVGSRTVRASVRERPGEEGRIRVRLPRTTPPAVYDGAVETDADSPSIPLAIEVLPFRRLKVSPANLNFAGKPGSDASAAFALVNAGNTPFIVPERAHVGIYDNEGLETAFAGAYRAETDDPMEMLKVFLGKLRDGHGGLLKLRIADSGPVQPGERRIFTAIAHLHEKLKSGHDYHGAWMLQDLNYAVSVNINSREG